MTQLFNQATYGGSLVEDEGKLVQKNYLKDKILTQTNFGFYSLFNVKESEKVVYDIQILLTKEPSKDELAILNSWHQKYRSS
jgi:hypothetical protein